MRPALRQKKGQRILQFARCKETHLLPVDWVPSLRSVFPSRHVTMTVHTADHHRYYEPAAILPASLALTRLFEEDFKRSVLSIPLHSCQLTVES
jgi:hypothetical protein